MIAHGREHIHPSNIPIQLLLYIFHIPILVSHRRIGWKIFAKDVGRIGNKGKIKLQIAVKPIKIVNCSQIVPQRFFSSGVEIFSNR